MMIHSNFFVIFVLLKNEGRKEEYHLKKNQKIFQIKKSDSMMETIITGEGKTTRQNQKRSFVIFHFSVS